MTCNPFAVAIAEHYKNVEKAINYLVDLYEDDVDISDQHIFFEVMKKYNLNEDGFESEFQYIQEEVAKRIT